MSIFGLSLSSPSSGSIIANRAGGFVWTDPDVSSPTHLSAKDYALTSGTGGIAFSQNGENMYTVDNATDTVTWHTLSTAWDLGTASTTGTTANFTSVESSLKDVFISPDGTKFYICGTSSDKIQEYTLSTPYDISTATASFATDAIGIGVANMWFQPNGARVYWGNADSIGYLSLSTPFDLSTYSSTQTVSSGIDSGFTTTVGGIWLSQNGLKLYIADTLRDTIVMYNLSTEWDLTSRSSTADVSSALTTGGSMIARGLFFNPDADAMYIGNDGSNELQQFSL